MCQSSKFLQEKCPRTCEKCKPGEILYKNPVNVDANLINCYEGYNVLQFVIIEFQFIANGVNLVTTHSALSRVEEDSKQDHEDGDDDADANHDISRPTRASK